MGRVAVGEAAVIVDCPWDIAGPPRRLDEVKFCLCSACHDWPRLGKCAKFIQRLALQRLRPYAERAQSPRLEPVIGR